MFRFTRSTVGSLILSGALAGSLFGGAAIARHAAAGGPGVLITSGVGTVDHPLLPDQNGNFLITVSPKNFVFDPADIGSPTNKPGSGHYHVYVDGFPRSFAQAYNPEYYLLAGATNQISLPMQRLAKAGAVTGTHTLYVVLANNNHAPLSPLSVASTVVRLGPSLKLLNPSLPSSPLVVPKTGAVTLHVSLNGFRFAPGSIGKARTYGEGHYHIYLDGFDPNNPVGKGYIGIGASDTVTVTAAQLAHAGGQPGIHTVYVVLANNDHSLVSPLTGDSESIEITS